LCVLGWGRHEKGHPVKRQSGAETYTNPHCKKHANAPGFKALWWLYRSWGSNPGKRVQADAPGLALIG
jgi:hypothetical protein